MNYESYNAVSTADDLSSFDFVSKGKKGEIRKRIIFMPTALSDAVATVVSKFLSCKLLSFFVNCTHEKDPNKSNHFLGQRDHLNGG
jgi:hypothetical protein